MAPPRRRRKRRPSRVVGAPVSVPEPEPAPPPRRGLLATLMGPPRTGQPVRRVAPRVVTGPPWTRADYYVLSAVTAGVIVVVGLFLAVTTGLSVSSTVQPSPTPSSASLTVASGDGAGFYPGEPVTVGSQQGTVASVRSNTITLTQPLDSTPKSGTSVSQSLALPFTTVASSMVATSPTPTTTTFDLANGENLGFFGVGTSLTVNGESETVKSVSGNQITLDSALSAPPVPGDSVMTTILNPGGLLTGILQLVADELAIVILPIAAFVARPMAARLRRKPRPRAWETIFFGAAIWVVDTLVLELLFSTVSVKGLGTYILTLVVAIASGFVVLPFIYPVLARFLRPRPRVPAAGSR